MTYFSLCPQTWEIWTNDMAIDMAIVRVSDNLTQTKLPLILKSGSTKCSVKMIDFCADIVSQIQRITNKQAHN